MSLRFISIGCVRRCATAAAQLGSTYPVGSSQPIVSTSPSSLGRQISLWNRCYAVLARKRPAEARSTGKPGSRISTYNLTRTRYLSPLSPSRRKISIVHRAYRPFRPPEFPSHRNSIDSRSLNETFVSIILGCRVRRAQIEPDARKKYHSVGSNSVRTSNIPPLPIARWFPINERSRREASSGQSPLWDRITFGR